MTGISFVEGENIKKYSVIFLLAQMDNKKHFVPDSLVSKVPVRNLVDQLDQ